MKRLGLLLALVLGIATVPALPAGAAADPQGMVDVVVVMKNGMQRYGVNAKNRQRIR